MIMSFGLVVVRDTVTELQRPHTPVATPSGWGAAVVPPAGSTMKMTITSSRTAAALIGTRVLRLKTMRFFVVVGYLRLIYGVYI
jgi:hypothetical protein